MADAKRDYYEVLGVPREADAKAIKDAFRQLALKFHPDRNKEPGAEERFKEIAEAYAVLSDPKKRADYDAGGFEGLKGMRPEDLFGGIDFENLFGGLGFDFGGSIFDRFFGGRGPGRRGPRGVVRGDNMELLLRVPLERVLSGGEEVVSVDHPVQCPVCKGARTKPGTSPRVCASCHGSGRQIRKSHEGGVMLEQITLCPDCGGAGSFIDQPCEECHGRGLVAHSESLTVKVPVGVEEGMALRIPGHGYPSPEAGGAPGDLFVIVRTLPDARFERDGADLWRVQDLAVADAALGTELEVPTLDGMANVTVPPGTQPDMVLRLRHKGLPNFGNRGRGDLMLRMRVLVPERLSAAERKLYEQLRELGRGRNAGGGR
ncbi:DnaJ C-terminal domain-containing protein [Azoarcus sp. KH32C]|uniref:DnaJ C-terminal domain-containing protein n=1 Tax=Azoarcus sp. KH32C TaxID=748247 RepID=UPI0002386B3C|nr:J domain-containing protein [Azoarcus sp. KH32C]BAL23823.1 chaperone protein [Azoarcus sp. KH32C]